MFQAPAVSLPKALTCKQTFRKILRRFNFVSNLYVYAAFLTIIVGAPCIAFFIWTSRDHRWHEYFASRRQLKGNKKLPIVLGLQYDFIKPFQCCHCITVRWHGDEKQRKQSGLNILISKLLISAAYQSMFWLVLLVITYVYVFDIN